MLEQTFLFIAIYAHKVKYIYICERKGKKKKRQTTSQKIEEEKKTINHVAQSSIICANPMNSVDFKAYMCMCSNHKTINIHNRERPNKQQI